MMCRGQRPRIGSWGAGPQERVAGTGEVTAFLPPPTPLQAIRAAGAHMFWCMRQPSAPTQPPPHRLRHTDTLPSRPPARLPAQAHSDALPAPLQAGPRLPQRGEGRALGCNTGILSHTHAPHTYICLRAHTHWLQLGFKYKFTSQCRESKVIFGQATGLSLSLFLLSVSISLSPLPSLLFSVSLCSRPLLSLFFLSPALSLCGSLGHSSPFLCEAAHAMFSMELLCGTGGDPLSQASLGQPPEHVETGRSTAQALWVLVGCGCPPRRQVGL